MLLDTNGGIAVNCFNLPSHDETTHPFHFRMHSIFVPFTFNSISFPVSKNGSVIDFFRPFMDRYPIRNMCAMHASPFAFLPLLLFSSQILIPGIVTFNLFRLVNPAVNGLCCYPPVS